MKISRKDLRSIVIQEMRQLREHGMGPRYKMHKDDGVPAAPVKYDGPKEEGRRTLTFTGLKKGDVPSVENSDGGDMGDLYDLVARHPSKLRKGNTLIVTQGELIGDMSDLGGIVGPERYEGQYYLSKSPDGVGHSLDGIYFDVVRPITVNGREIPAGTGVSLESGFLRDTGTYSRDSDSDRAGSGVVTAKDANNPNRRPDPPLGPGNFLNEGQKKLSRRELRDLISKLI